MFIVLIVCPIIGVYVVKWDVAPWFTLKAPQHALRRTEGQELRLYASLMALAIC
tara:strand:+ start:196 stop:357 length:162 start_codon:yes stop_codon:yes gene_type:complete